MEQKQEQTEEEIIVEVADTLDGQHFNIVVYPSRVIVTRVAGKTHGTRRYTNDLQTASLQQQVKELREERDRLKEENKKLKAYKDWYSADEIYHFLKRNKYSDEIAKELSTKWADHLREAFKTGYSKAEKQLQEEVERLKNALKVIFERDFTAMLTTVPEGIKHRADTYNEPDQFEDNGTYEEYARYTSPAQWLLVDAYIQALSGKESKTDK
jgi:hypothetical protein